MSDQPTPLDDDDLTEEAPPGYRSQKHRERYIPLMATLLVGTFLLQSALPFLVFIVAMPLIAMQTLSLSMPQYGKGTAWQEAIWFPARIGPGGGGSGCKLQAIDYQGKPLPKQEIEVDTQPAWLLADGDRLWAVSAGEVAEIYADGSRPQVMHPTRFLSNPSQPFLYEGELAVADADDDDNWSLFTFDKGEWIERAKLDLSGIAAPATPSTEEEDAPADALNPDKGLSPEQELQAKRKAIQQFIQSASGKIDRVQIVRIHGNYHVAFSQGGKLYHRATLPLADDDGTAEPGPAWNLVTSLSTNAGTLRGMRGAQTDGWSLACVAGQPAIVIALNQRGATQLWRETDGQWQIAANSKSPGNHYNPEVLTFTTPDGSRTFAVVDQLNGMMGELSELHADRIDRITALGRGTTMSDPMVQVFIGLYAAAFLSPLVVMGLTILAATWLMKTHREPCYFKGRIAVRFASLLRRCVANLLDFVLCSVPMYLGWYLWYQQRRDLLGPLFEDIDQNPRPFFLELVPLASASAAWLVLFTAGSWLMLARWGSTPGKWLCGVRVARTSLEPPGLLRSLVRMIVSPMETGMMVIVPLALIAFTLNRQHLSDLIGGLVVVKAGSLRQARAELAAKALESRL